MTQHNSFLTNPRFAQAFRNNVVSRVRGGERQAPSGPREINRPAPRVRGTAPPQAGPSTRTVTPRQSGPKPRAEFPAPERLSFGGRTLLPARPVAGQDRANAISQLFARLQGSNNNIRSSARSGPPGSPTESRASAINNLFRNRREEQGAFSSARLSTTKQQQKVSLLNQLIKRRQV